ncbi:hypothetical protein COO60DRAFT_1646855 [Scenedesmus sp. NREL 46B-D3]|nr:hypothetical protein COO60DRAFT_1646855 [Scenedesmus sp. NREL 46B-D3]
MAGGLWKKSTFFALVVTVLTFIGKDPENKPLVKARKAMLGLWITSLVLGVGFGGVWAIKRNEL